MGFSILGNDFDLDDEFEEEIIEEKRNGNFRYVFNSAKEYGETSKDLIKRWHLGGVEVCNYVDNIKEGAFEIIYNNGDIETGTYVNDKKEGKFIIEDKFGNKLTGKYVKNIREGNFIYEGLVDLTDELSIFGNNYQAYVEGVYKNGLIEGKVEYYYYNVENIGIDSYSINKITSNYIAGLKDGLEIESIYSIRNNNIGHDIISDGLRFHERQLNLFASSKTKEAFKNLAKLIDSRLYRDINLSGYDLKNAINNSYSEKIIKQTNYKNGIKISK